MRVAGLAIHPLKSGAGIDVMRWPLVDTGLRDDRRFMLVDPSGVFVTLRGNPRLVTVHTTLTRAADAAASDGDVARFSIDGAAPLSVSLVADPDPRRFDVQIWGTYVSAALVSDAADVWFTAIVGKPVRLVRFDAPERRQVNPRYAQPGDSVHFADEFPLLVCGTASLALLSERFGQSLSMSRFRPNVVVETTVPFIEDAWRRIRVGDVAIDIVKPCARCVGVNVEPGTGRTSKEPLATLARFRTFDNKVLFGQNAIHRGVGVLSVGDPVEVLAAAET